MSLIKKEVIGTYLFFYTFIVLETSVVDISMGGPRALGHGFHHL